MIIKTIKLQPFGGMSNKELAFKPGLNVILGPNEAGKSTVFHAIQKALLVPTELYKKEYEKEIAAHLPIGGGDTVHVAMQFESGGVAYILKKSWGKTRAAYLQLPGGAVLTADEAVTKQIEALLPAMSGTVRSILMTYQSGLEKTLDDLEEEGETIRSLGDILRKAVLATDGISVEGFLAKVQEKQAEYFSRWDKQRNYPEGGRGIERPWDKKVGHILKAHYEKERLRVSYEAASAYEIELDKLNRSIAELEKSVSERDAYVKANRKIIEDIKTRRTLEAEVQLASVRQKELKQVSATWPVIEKEIIDLESLIPGLKDKGQAVVKERAAAETAEKSKAIREQYGRACQKKELLVAAEKELAGVKKLDKAGLDQIRLAQQKLEKLIAGLTAGVIAVKLKPKSDISLMVEKDLEQKVQHDLKTGSITEVKAGGRLVIVYADLEMEISSGAGDFEKVRQAHDSAKQELSALLNKYQAETLEQAVEVHADYAAKLEKVEKAAAVNESELAGVSFEDLESKIRELGEVKAARPLAEIILDVVQAQNDITQKEKDLADRRKTMAEYVTKYKDQDNLLDELVKMRLQDQTLQKELTGLAPLPPEVTDIEAYQRKYDKNLLLLDEEREKINKLQLEQAGMNGQAPDETSEELKVQYDDSVRHFESVEKKAEAIERIGTAAKKIVEAAGTDIYKDLEKDLASYAAAITDNKYSKVKMDQSMPVGFIRDDGNVVGYDLLSFGTKDMLSLALRLAMAKHFLDSSDGFLAMDDPLVNMDPVRQTKAADILKTYAKDKQVIIFTCHPKHSEMLAGNVINL